MIHLPASVRVYLCLTPCDMRRSFDGLHALVREHLEWDAFAGHLFVFARRRRDRVKILYWDRDGFAMWSKRLEEGTYAVPFGDSGEERRREITAQELGTVRKLLEQLEVILFYTCGRGEPQGYSAAVPFLVSLLGRTDASFSSGRRERGYRMRRGLGGSARDGGIPPSDYRRDERTESAENVARDSTPAIPSPAAGGWAKEDRRERPDPL